MKEESIESVYEKHLKNEPKIISEHGFETKEHIKWHIEKENLRLVMTIPKEKRQEIMEYLKHGYTIGETAEHFNIKDHMAVGYLLYARYIHNMAVETAKEQMKDYVLHWTYFIAKEMRRLRNNATSIKNWFKRKRSHEDSDA